MSLKNKLIFIILCCILTTFYFSNIFNRFSDDNYSVIKEVKLNYRLSHWLLTAFSSSHFEEALQNCKSVRDLKETHYWLPGYMIAYILKNDLSKQQLDQYHYECPFVHLRHFNVSKYPKFVQNLNEYRWKPIIVSEVLEEVESVFYFDSSIIFLNQDGESIKDVFQKMDTEFSKCGIRQFGRVGHTIFAATHPKMFELFNISSQIVKQNFMYSANSFVVTPKASKIIRKWTECALEKECMAPEGSKLYCMLPILWEGKYANCHRFDQSALALLTLQCSLDTKDFFQPSYLLDTKRIESPPFVTREMIFILLIFVGIFLIYLLSSNRNVSPFEFLESSKGPSKSSAPRGVPP